MCTYASPIKRGYPSTVALRQLRHESSRRLPGRAYGHSGTFEAADIWNN